MKLGPDMYHLSTFHIAKNGCQLKGSWERNEESPKKAIKFRKSPI